MTRSTLRQVRSTVVGVLAIAASASAWAVEFKSVGNDPAVLYDAPTLRGNRLAVAPRGMPLEVVFAQNDWIKVRDSGGALSWVEKKSLADRRMLVATGSAPVDVHAAADDNAPVVFRVQPGVLMELAGAPASGWVAVRHRDGQSGFVRVGGVWGE